MTSGRLYWTCQIAGWGGYAITQSLAAALTLNLPWPRAVLEALFLHGSALGLSHALRGYMKRRYYLELPKLALRAVAAALVLGAPLGIVMQFTSLSALHDVAELGLSIPWSMGPAVVLLLNMLNWSAAFMLWLALYYGVQALRQYRSAELRRSELARALQLAELRLLKSQLNPHFLFNALNTVRSLIADDPCRARGRHSPRNTLRYTLASGQDSSSPSTRARDRAGLPRARVTALRGSVEHRLHRHGECTSRPVPVMLLQTVVENAIKHGIAALPAGGVLKIRGDVTDGMLDLEIENPRPVLPLQKGREGIGLRNAAERLRLLFGARASIDVDLSQHALATIRIRIPEGA
jgi:hypothetical protein